MTRDEIKQTYTMADVLARYGMKPNRAGFIQCTFHREKSASMKIYKDSYYCFGCGCSGDIFTFVQEHEGLSFKDAFCSLGGEYEKPTFRSNLAIYRAKKRMGTEQIRKRKLESEKQLNQLLIGAYRIGIMLNQPMSDAWVENYNKLQYQLYVHAELNGLEF